MGRFISEDPVGFAAGDTNRYAYVGNNPVDATVWNHFDRYIGIVSGAVVGGAIGGAAGSTLGPGGAAAGAAAGGTTGAVRATFGIPIGACIWGGVQSGKSG